MFERRERVAMDIAASERREGNECPEGDKFEVPNPDEPSLRSTAEDESEENLRF